jgi:hypothetical protein
LHAVLETVPTFRHQAGRFALIRRATQPARLLLIDHSESSEPQVMHARNEVLQMPPPSSKRRHPSPASPPVAERESGEQLCANERPTIPSPPPAPDVSVEHIRVGAPIDEVLYRMSVGDYDGALSVGESLMVEDPIPLVIVPKLLIAAMKLAHREEYVLSFVDGWSTMREVVEATRLPEVDALRSLCELLEKNILALR